MAIIPDCGHLQASSLDSLNRLARDRGWTVRCDGSGRYYVPELADLHAIWRANAGACIPLRSAMTARLLKHYLKILVLHERVAAPDGSRCYRARLMGEQTAEVVGEGTGKFYGEFVGESLLPMWNAMSDAVLAYGGPVRFVLAHDAAGFKAGEAFAAPLSTDDGRMDLILSAVRFLPVWTWKDILAHWEEDMAAMA